MATLIHCVFVNGRESPLFSKLMSAFQWEFSSLSLAESLSVKVIYADDMASRSSTALVLWSKIRILLEIWMHVRVFSLLVFSCVGTRLHTWFITRYLKFWQYSWLAIMFCGNLRSVKWYTIAVTRRFSLLLFSGSLLCIQVCLIASIFRIYAVQDGMHRPWRYRHIDPPKRR